MITHLHGDGAPQPADCVLSEALRLARIGLSVIPVGRDKKPALRSWRAFQREPADEPTIRDWFDRRDDLGLGIVLGEVSRGLVVRDFDQPESYAAWATAFRKLADALPTVATARGRHVYLRTADPVRTKPFSDGELRGAGSYVICPPSVHPSGCQYRWLRPLASLVDVPLLSVADAGFDRDWRQEESPRDQQILQIANSVPSVGFPSVAVDDSIIERLTVPAVGFRRQKLFALARYLKGKAEWSHLHPEAFREVFSRWHERSCPHMREKSLETNWQTFVDAWRLIDPERCTDGMAVAMQRADAKEIPALAARYQHPMLKRLVALCVELATTSGNGVFYASCRKTAEVLGTGDFPMVAGWLRLLVADGVLAVVEKGGPHTNRATRYRFVAESFDHKP